MTRWIRFAVFACVTSILCVPSNVRAQETVTIVAGERYDAGALHRFVLGPGYRDLWKTPIQVSVLDLSTFAGGLTPVRRGGGQQTATLRLRAPDGREFVFRSVDKDPRRSLPEALRETIIGDLAQDQTSSGHPVGALVVAQLLEAVGVLHAQPLLVVMPDDPRLGEHRQEFAGLLGLLEVRPDELEDRDAGFAGAIRIVGADAFERAIEADPLVRPDAKAFLRARLMDIFLGDWDRHRDQWRWALTDQDGPLRWMPIPRDRDMAFSKYDGLVIAMGRRLYPQFVNFGPKYAHVVGQTWNGHLLDRRILPDLSWDAWLEVATELRSQLTDEALARAVEVLPTAYLPLERDRLSSTLRTRRDQLVEEASRFYRLLAREVDIHASDRSDHALVTRMRDGRVRVELSVETVNAPYYARTFAPNETADIRIWMHGDDDLGEVRGEGDGPTVRLLGGGGDDHFVDAASGGTTRFYDDRGSNTAAGRALNEQEPIAPSTAVPGMPVPRDWGTTVDRYLTSSVGPDMGLTVTGQVIVRRFGFRKWPHATRLAWSGGWATGAGTFNTTLEGDWRKENSRLHFGFKARGSGIEVLRWYGKGNDTTPGRNDEFNRVLQHVVAFSPRVALDFGDHSSFEIGPSMKFSITSLDTGKNAHRFIALSRPFGTGAFGQFGATATYAHDTRDRQSGASHGSLLKVRGAVYPISDGDAFGRVDGEASTFWSPVGRDAPTLALRVGGRKLWGNYPFFEAATIGGPSLRGFRTQRFAGDASAWANGELRIKVFDARIIVPGEVGVFGFADAGRVWLKGEDSDTWHTSTGGGVWFGVLSRSVTVSLSLARSQEGTRFYAGSGFGF